jgi:hypothetical protein
MNSSSRSSVTYTSGNGPLLVTAGSGDTISGLIDDRRLRAPAIANTAFAPTVVWQVNTVTYTVVATVYRYARLVHGSST